MPGSVKGPRQNEFACELRLSVSGEDSPLPPRLLQWLALRHEQAHRHQTSWQERVCLLSGTETLCERAGGGRIHQPKSEALY